MKNQKTQYTEKSYFHADKDNFLKRKDFIMKLLFIKTGAIVLALGILLGAFGAHILKEKISANALSSFEIGIRYLIYNGIGLMFIGVQNFTSQKVDRVVYYSIVLGIVFFSGSIFILSTQCLPQIPKAVFIPMTPIGGSMLIFSWVYFALNCGMSKS